MKKPVNADCEALNRAFGGPGRIVFRPSRHNVPIVVLANQYGSAEISLLGAQTISYRPTGNQPVLFMPHPYDDTPAGKEIHGGIPICWPWFARNGPQGSKMHGVARYSVWTVKGSDYSEDESSITLGLASDEETLKAWPYEFELELKIQLSMKLTLGLRAINKSGKDFPVTEGFHPYFRVSERDKTEVLGVNGLEFTDTRFPEKPASTWVGNYPVNCSGSNIFDATKYEYALMDHGLDRAIAVVSRGNLNLVVWNSGEESAAQVAEYGIDGWRKFVCVEPCTTPKSYVLKAGETHDIMIAIQSIPKENK